VSSDAEAWANEHVTPVGSIALVSDEPWAKVSRIAADSGTVWLKECAPVQGFEPRLSAELFARWPDRVAPVLAVDVERGWLLLGDAGTQLRELENPLETWLTILPEYAEMQRGEAAHAREHVAQGVPDLRPLALIERHEAWLRDGEPLDDDGRAALGSFTSRFATMCETLDAADVPSSVQHDDLHGTNVYVSAGGNRVIDWGDASIAHPFFSLVVTFRDLREVHHIALDDPWFARLRDAYLEPWGPGYNDLFALALRIGAIAHAIAWQRQRDALPTAARASFDEAYEDVLRDAIDAARLRP
jgi:hypothetical protein